MGENELYLKLSEKIDKLCDKLDVKFDLVEGKLQNHEVRIVVLEQKPLDEKTKDWKTEIITLLVKAVVIGAVSIASLVGASGIVANILGGGHGNNEYNGTGKSALFGTHTHNVVCEVSGKIAPTQRNAKSGDRELATENC